MYGNNTPFPTSHADGRFHLRCRFLGRNFYTIVRFLYRFLRNSAVYVQRPKEVIRLRYAGTDDAYFSGKGDGALTQERPIMAKTKVTEAEEPVEVSAKLDAKLKKSTKKKMS